ncbi:MAG: hypothetical protein KAV82_01060 [Phycisphaerae bacterium]|nr:hypothetical protein [Phycisphaerae bacterium]
MKRWILQAAPYLCVGAVLCALVAHGQVLSNDRPVADTQSPELQTLADSEAPQVVKGENELTCAPADDEPVTDAIARAFSTVVGVLSSIVPTDAITREFSVLVGNIGAIYTDDAVTREFSVLVSDLGSIEPDDSVTREFSVLVGDLGSIEPDDSVTREFSVLVGDLEPPAVTDGATREFSVYVGPDVPPLLEDAIGREFSVYILVPDLEPLTIDAPTNGLTSQIIAIAWDVANNGDISAQSPWIDRIYLSPDQTLDGSDHLLGSYTFDDAQGLPIGSEYHAVALVTLPDVDPGFYWLILSVDDDEAVGEAGGESNNIARAALPMWIDLDARPDLVVANFTPPGNLVPGQPVEVAWTLENVGTADAVGPWSETIYGSDGGAPTELATFVYTDTLRPGDPPRVRMETFIMPDVPVSPGNYSVIVCLDSTDDLRELQEDNNCVTEEVCFDCLQPDLVVSGIVEPAFAFGGETAELTWAVTNVGNAEAEGNWTDSVYLSSDDAVGNDVWVADFGTNGPLASSNAFVRTKDVPIPPEFDGNYYFVVVTDAYNTLSEPGGEGNNTAIATGPTEIVQEERPDLEVVSVVGPVSATAGGSIILEYTVENIGPETAMLNWQESIYLSENPEPGPHDQLVRLDPISEAPFGPGDTYTKSRTLMLPVGYQAVTVYFIVKTDHGDVVPEFDKSNNVGVSDGIEVTPTPAPDLVATNGVAPASATFGEDITVNWSGKNLGTLEATGVWSDLIFLSADETVSIDDRFLGTLSIDVAPLGVGDPPYNRLLEVTLPLDGQTVAGDYYVLVKADGNNAIDELDETNNVEVIGPITLGMPPLPDLEVLSVSGPATVTVSETAQIEWEISNLGAVPIDVSFLMTVFVSADNQVGNDTALLNVAFEGTLAPGESVPQSAEVTIPELGTEQVHFVVCADTAADVLEFDEGNNCTVSVNASPYKRPDLQAGSFITPATAVAESSVPISGWVENGGSAPAIPYWIDAIYLSTDPAFGNDILLGTEAHTGQVPPGAGYTVPMTVTIPADLSGDYYFIFETDRDDRVIEIGDPQNNIYVSTTPTTISQPDRPDLIVSDIVTPAPGLSGQPMLVQWTVSNVGDASADGFWLDRVVVSLDREFGEDDLVLADFENLTPLGTNGSYTRQVTLEYPSVPGDYYVLIITDVANSVHEGLSGDENNNLTADESTFTVTTFTVTTAQADIDEAPAGTAVTITGQAFIDDGTPTPTDPAVDVPVVVRVAVRGFERRLIGRTDGAGEFEVVFEPGPTEGGLYRVFAGPEHLPSTELGELDRFSLWALVVIPDYISESVAPGIAKVGQFTLKNPGDEPQTGITAMVNGAPANINVEITLPEGADLPGLNSTIPVQYTITAADETPVIDPIEIVLTSDQGATATAMLEVSVGPALPTLVVADEDLADGAVSTTMVRGEL